MKEIDEIVDRMRVKGFYFYIKPYKDYTIVLYEIGFMNNNLEVVDYITSDELYLDDIHLLVDKILN